MKKQINELAELGDAYATFGVEVLLPMSHTLVRGPNCNFDWKLDGKVISVYLASGGETWQVQFDKVEVVGYMKKINLPFDVTVKYLNELIEDVRGYLYDHLFPNVAKCKIGVLKDKHNKIRRLEGELRKLKGLVTQH